MLVAANEWRSRVFAVRYVVSFGASTLAVPLVAVVHPSCCRALPANGKRWKP